MTTRKYYDVALPAGGAVVRKTLILTANERKRELYIPAVDITPNAAVEEISTSVFLPPEDRPSSNVSIIAPVKSFNNGTENNNRVIVQATGNLIIKTGGNGTAPGGLPFDVQISWTL